MISFIFVSDIHLNLRKNFKWELDRFKQLVDKIKEQQADYLILGGDIFDKANPNLDEISAFYYMVDKVKDNFQEIILISGNHEDLDKNTTCYHKLPQVGFTFLEFTNEPYIKSDGFAFYFASHHKINKIKDIEVSNKKNILFSHIRSSIGIVKAEASMNKISKQFDYVFLGDIHIPYKPYKNVEYCGSPYTIQYEGPRDTGFFRLEFDKGNMKIDFINTKHLPQKVKFIMTVDEYNHFLAYFDKANLYKIVLKDNVKSLENLKIPNNVSIVFSSTLSNNELEEEVYEIKKVGNINVIDTFLNIMENREELNKEILQEGQKLLDEFKREYYK